MNAWLPQASCAVVWHLIFSASFLLSPFLTPPLFLCISIFFFGIPPFSAPPSFFWRPSPFFMHLHLFLASPLFFYIPIFFQHPSPFLYNSFLFPALTVPYPYCSLPLLFSALAVPSIPALAVFHCYCL